MPGGVVVIGVLTVALIDVARAVVGLRVPLQPLRMSPSAAADAAVHLGLTRPSRAASRFTDVIRRDEASGKSLTSVLISTEPGRPT